MNGKPVLILGATSAIARAVANEFAMQGEDVYLAGRDLPELWKIASDIEIRHKVIANVGVFDAEDTKSHGNFILNAINRTSGFSGAVLAFGYMGDQTETESCPELAKGVIDRNFTGAASILLHLANHFEETRTGFIIGISSVAGDRGRMSNYVYGSAKAGLNVFLQGLRSRLAKVGVPVLTVKPGPTDTAMTFGMSDLPLLASPQDVAKQIVRASRKRKDVVYVPGAWKWIMLVIRSIPERVFKKLKF